MNKSLKILSISAVMEFLITIGKSKIWYNHIEKQFGII